MWSYKLGIPIATVLFLTLMGIALYMVRASVPTERDHSAVVGQILRDLRLTLPDILPLDNSDRTGVVIVAEAQEVAVEVRIYGLLDRDHQQRTIDTLRMLRQQHAGPPLAVEFFYPLERATGIDPALAVPTHDQRPEAFRTERL